MIGNEKSEKRDDGRNVDVEVEIRFVRRGEPLALARDFFEAVIHNVENVGQSPWRLAELRMSPADQGATDGWRCEKIVFGRTEDSSGGRLLNPRPGGHPVLRMLRDQLDAVDKRGVRCRLTRIEITPWNREDGSDLRIEFALEGAKPEDAFRQVRQVFAKACSGDGPFTGLVSASDTPSAREADDRSYQLSLRLQLDQPETRKDRDGRTESELEKKKGEPKKKKEERHGARRRLETPDD